MSNYIPNKVQILKNNDRVGSSQNIIGNEIYQSDNIVLFLKEQVKTNNFVDCFSFNNKLFYIACSEGTQFVLNNNDTKFDFEQGKLIIEIQNIWRAKWSGESPEEGKGYLTIANSYFCIGGIKSIIKKSYDQNSVDEVEGYISNMVINLDYEEDSIMNFLRLTNIFIQNNSSQQAEINELKSKFQINWNNQYYTFCIPGAYQSIVYLLDFDKIRTNMNFFSSKVLTKSTLDITFSRSNTQGIKSEQTYKYPIEFRFKNKLIQICNGNLSSNTLNFVISEKNTSLFFLLWCPDISYFNYTINNVNGSLVVPEVSDIGFSYKLFKFNFNIDNYEGNESFYYILNCFYNQGEVQDNQVFTINLSVDK